MPTRILLRATTALTDTEGAEETLEDVTLDDLVLNEHAVNVHESPQSAGTYVACADVRNQ
ncbi:MAG TPA: hypothetical protein VML35_08460 [Gaiellaceae bacterium]|nr:hypothetical protein [Gaiellaceae bacterium]